MAIIDRPCGNGFNSRMATEADLMEHCRQSGDIWPETTDGIHAALISSLSIPFLQAGLGIQTRGKRPSHTYLLSLYTFLRGIKVDKSDG